MDLLTKASSPEVINNAWKRFRRDNAIWRPGISKKEMETDIVFHMLKLAEELRSKQYSSDLVRFFPVNKGDGSKRIISAYTLRDKVAQRAILTVLEPIGEKIFHPDSYGYRPGRTIEMALSRVRECMLCGLSWTVDADIQSFFDNIPHKPLIRILKSLVKDNDMVKLIRRWLDVGAFRRGFLSTTKGIPQGSVISPFLCNLYLTEFDQALALKNLPFVRFADDFLVFADSEKNAHSARLYVEKSLRKLHLSLNPKKTRVTSCGPAVKFLGKKLPKLARGNIA